LSRGVIQRPALHSLGYSRGGSPLKPVLEGKKVTLGLELGRCCYMIAAAAAAVACCCYEMTATDGSPATSYGDVLNGAPRPHTRTHARTYTHTHTHTHTHGRWSVAKSSLINCRQSRSNGTSLLSNASGQAAFAFSSRSVSILVIQIWFHLSATNRVACIAYVG